MFSGDMPSILHGVASVLERVPTCTHSHHQAASLIHAPMKLNWQQGVLKNKNRPRCPPDVCCLFCRCRYCHCMPTLNQNTPKVTQQTQACK
eukprot:5184740-Amphidinium_carterae.1